MNFLQWNSNKVVRVSKTRRLIQAQNLKINVQLIFIMIGSYFLLDMLLYFPNILQ